MTTLTLRKRILNVVFLVALAVGVSFVGMGSQWRDDVEWSCDD
jgi:hypothetical protein